MTAGAITRVQVTVTPPAYSDDPTQELTDPVAVTALAGSRIRMAVMSSLVVVVRDGAGDLIPTIEEGGRFIAEVTAERSGSFSLTPASGPDREGRLIALLVRPDLRPVVRIGDPGRDLALPNARSVDLALEASDDVGLQSVAVRYTRVSGSGESFTFAEGEVPVQIQRHDGRRWTATARWPLDLMKLEEGDALVYRAVARDGNPRGEEAVSESFVVEIGGRSKLASAGFALPEDDRKYAISQQMVIVKTERLLAERATTPVEALVERARVVGVEQRMVKAEFIFLSGGEVEDEVVEAEHSHELVEGRLENVGRVEMLRAIAAMTRAEERLNAGDPAGALVHERAALQALQRAFDRRRYFLRVVAERARIDAARRLSGSVQDARPWVREEPAPVDVLDTVERGLMRELAAAARADRADLALAARVAGVDPEAAEWQALARELVGPTPESRRQAALRAMDAVRARVVGRLAPALEPRLGRDALIGYAADEDRRRGGLRR
jgi:hypothetical protein